MVTEAERSRSVYIIHLACTDDSIMILPFYYSGFIAPPIITVTGSGAHHCPIEVIKKEDLDPF